MKKLFAALFLVFVACATPPPVEKPKPHEDIPISKVTISKGKTSEELVLDKEEFLSIYRLAEHYVALRDSVSNASVDKNVTVKKVTDDQYTVTIKLDDQMSVTAIVNVDNTEMKKLRDKMKRITTEEPKAEVKRLSSSKFKITLTVDDVKFTTTIDVDQTRGFDLQSFFWGLGMGMTIGGILAKAGAAKAAVLLLPFL